MSASTMSKDNAFRLMIKYLDGTLDNSGLAELNRCIIGDPTIRRQVAYLVLQNTQLDELGQAERAFEGTEAVDRPRTAPAFSWRSWVAAWARLGSNWVVGSAAACALVTAACLFLWPLSNQPRFAEVKGTAVVKRGEQSQPARNGGVARPGDQILLGAGSSTAIKYWREETALRLGEAGQLQLLPSKKGKQFALQNGSLSCVVGRQPEGTPLRISTRQAEVVVLGTDFELLADQDATRLQVWNGNVRVSRLSDGSSVEVAKGHWATVGSGSAPSSERMPIGVLCEIWRSIQGTKVRDLTSSPRFAERPTERTYLSRLELATRNEDWYGVRMRGWVSPPKTGEYQFWVAGDDDAEFWLSSNETPEALERVCFTPEYTAPLEWAKRKEQASRKLRLTEGRRYYLEVFMKQDGGAACVAVAWQGPGFNRQVIEGECLSPVIPLDMALAPKR